LSESPPRASSSLQTWSLSPDFFFENKDWMVFDSIPFFSRFFFPLGLELPAPKDIVFPLALSLLPPGPRLGQISFRAAIFLMALFPCTKFQAFGQTIFLLNTQGAPLTTRPTFALPRWELSEDSRVGQASAPLFPFFFSFTLFWPFSFLF